MNVADIQKLYAYDEWANDRLFRSAAELSDEQFRATIVSSFPSVGATLAHIAGAEWVWLQRFQGAIPAQPPEWVAVPPLARLRERLNEVELERAAFLKTLAAPWLDEELAYKNLSGEPKRGNVGDLLVHVVNHSTYHRGQVVTMLRQLGVVPPATDLLIFSTEGK